MYQHYGDEDRGGSSDYESVLLAAVLVCESVAVNAAVVLRGGRHQWPMVFAFSNRHDTKSAERLLNFLISFTHCSLFTDNQKSANQIYWDLILLDGGSVPATSGNLAILLYKW